jgi:hypothetical protein
LFYQACAEQKGTRVYGLLLAGELRGTPHSVHSRWAKVKYRAVAVKEQGTTLFTELKLKTHKGQKKTSRQQARVH